MIARGRGGDVSSPFALSGGIVAERCPACGGQDVRRAWLVEGAWIEKEPEGATLERVACRSAFCGAVRYVSNLGRGARREGGPGGVGQPLAGPGPVVRVGSRGTGDYAAAGRRRGLA